jgi:hypothetical protein
MYYAEIKITNIETDTFETMKVKDTSKKRLIHKVGTLATPYRDKKGYRFEVTKSGEA